MKLNISAFLADAALTLAVTFSWISLTLSRPVAEPLLLEMVAMVICVLPLLWSRTALPQFLTFILVTLSLAFAWLVEFGAAAATVGLIGFAIFLVRRVRSVTFLQEDFAQFRTLLWDLGIMLVSLFVAYASSDGLPSSHMENNALEIGFVVATALRLASLRNSQIALAAREGAVLVPTLTKPILVLAGSLGLGLGILYWYPRLLMYLFFGGLVVGGFYTYRDKRNAIDTLRNVFLFALTFLYLIYLRQHHRKLANQRRHLVNPYASLMHVHLDFWYLLALVTLIDLFIVAYVRQLRRARGSRMIVQVAPIVERTRMDERTARWRRGSSALGQLLVSWLDREERRGRVPQRGETVRRFFWRIRGEDPAGVDDESQVVEALINRYEAERYGLQPAREEEVSALAERLGPRRTGRGIRRSR